MPPSVEVLFIPVLDDAHWRLYVVVNYIGHGISTLKGREGILYMDPLNGKPKNNIDCYVRSAVEIVYGPWDRAKNVLLPPITTLMIPHQPNGTIVVFISCMLSNNSLKTCFKD